MELRKLAEGRGPAILRMPLDKIEEGDNLRVDYGNLDELARQIAEEGQLVPMVIRHNDKKDGAVIIDGHRRYRAIKLAKEKYNLDTDVALCILEERGANEESRIVHMFQYGSGKPLTALEQAEAIYRLQNTCKLCQADIARKTGKPAAEVSRLLTLRSAPAVVREALNTHLLSPVKAEKLLKLTQDKQDKFFTEIKETLDFNKTHQTKKKSPVKVKDVEKAQRGHAYNVSGARINDAMEQALKLIDSDTKKATQWKAVLYGLEIALLGKEIDPAYEV